MRNYKPSLFLFLYIRYPTNSPEASVICTYNIDFQEIKENHIRYSINFGIPLTKETSPNLHASTCRFLVIDSALYAWICSKI